jgi:DNA-binding transcriptional MerR regulator
MLRGHCRALRPPVQVPAAVAPARAPPYPFRAEERGAMSDRLSFKEMCAAFDVTPRTLRYYEYIELLQPEREGRQRFYGPRERARMTLILRGRRYGFQLEEIRQWLLIYEHEGTEAQMRAFVELADRQLEELARQKAQLDEAIEELRQMRERTAAEVDLPARKG